MPHDVLRTVANPITSFSDELRGLVDDLFETMQVRHGVGLAAPQIGESVQAFVIAPSRSGESGLAVMNPVLEGVSGRTSIVEGCLSLPDVWEEVPRWASVRLKGQDPSGNPLDLKVQGVLAGIIQHELDHLHGLLLIDR